MTKRSRILLVLASLLLFGAYVFPIWRIDLDAPQYPEGLGMKIEVDNIVGKKPNDLDNINNLNHYIGMKRIEPDAIPELRWMPWIIGGLILFGFAAAASGRNAMLYAWLAVFGVVAVAGLVDFYLWAYDYGHNLDHEHAIIKIPGMSYQPPLIGSKQLLNFTAHSWPALGGWLVFLAGGLGVLAVVLDRLKPQAPQPQQPPSSSRATKRPGALVPLVLALLLAACRPASEPIRYGHDACAHCRMTVSDARYGAELVTERGKVYKFDSVECLAAFLDAGAAKAEDAAFVLVADYERPETLVSVDDAFFLHSPDLRSPMGANLTAFGPGSDREAVLAAYDGDVLDWEGARALVRAARNAAAAGTPHGAHGM